MTAAARAPHQAVLHAGPADLAALLEERVGRAVEAGMRVLAVVGAATGELLRDRLGPTAAEVDFVEPGREHAAPAFTVAARWARLGRAAARGALVVAEQGEVPDTADPDRANLHWARLDIALDVALDPALAAPLHGPAVEVVCAYPAAGPDADRVRATHVAVTTAAGTEPSPLYRPPAEAVVAYPPPPPPDLGPPTVARPFAAADLAGLRRLVGDIARTRGVARDRIADLVLATSEVASNTIEHGPGHGVLSLWAAPGELVVEVADRGRIDLPFPGLVTPPPDGPRGRGLWLASEVVDVLAVWSGPTGTVVRLHLERAGLSRSAG